LGDENLDKKDILGMLNSGLTSASYPFEDVARAFKLIDDQSQQTVYCLREHPDLEKRLYNGERNREIFREINPYAINLYEYDVRKLREAGAIDVLDKSVILLTGEYDIEMGVKLSPEGGQAFFV
jgi:CRISPR-associated endonuclease/helicase Cas3